jgi:hypothetical protein
MDPRKRQLNVGHYSEKFLDLCFLFGNVVWVCLGYMFLFGLFFGRWYIFVFLGCICYIVLCIIFWVVWVVWGGA